LLIARYHGVRLNETNVNPMKDVKLWDQDGERRGEIEFRQKGNRIRKKPLHPKLIALFDKLRNQKATSTYIVWQWGNRWTKLLTRCGIKDRDPNACFHSTRVTVETRLARAGVDKAIRMAYLTHENGDVNDSYNRFKPDDLRVCHTVAL
jgi:integrase